MSIERALYERQCIHGVDLSKENCMQGQCEINVRRLKAEGRWPLKYKYNEDESLNEEEDCLHANMNISVHGRYCEDCDEVFEDNTGSNLMGG